MDAEHTGGPNMPSGRGGAQALSLDHPFLRSVCHRAKNDLQTAANLLALAAPLCSDPFALAEMVEGRIFALSDCYDLVSQTGGLPLLPQLARRLAERVCARRQCHCDLQINLEDLPLSLRICSPLSLWLYEALDNALLHGNKGVSRPHLELGSRQDSEGLSLWVRDQGGGPPPDPPPSPARGLGLRLMRAIATSDLGGQSILDAAHPGTRARLVVPHEELQNLNKI